jgi:hypothetical protein
MCEEININVNETNENINIISTEIVEVIDINVGETTEEVTFNITEEVIQVNINKIIGGGGEQTLAQTLVFGNTTEGQNISISNGDAIILDNGSMLKKGTIDAGDGGAGGIAQICGVGFEHKWEAGRLYIMNSNGNVIREVSHNFNIVPTTTDDVTKGFVQDTRWILDNGDVYVCTDPTEDAAVWELQITQVNSDWNATSGVAEILNKPTITDGTVTSVGLTMPSAFSVTNSPITSTGDIAVTGAGLVSQYVRGDGTLANFPNSTGGGSSVNYYLNGSVSQGTFGGTTYYQMSKTPILGAGTNFTRTNAQGNGYIASFITDAGDPSFLNIPGGNWNLEFYFQSSATGGSPQFYAELYKVSATNTFTLVASGSANPEGITNGTTIDQYYTSIPVPQTSLLITDRLAIRIYVITSGRTITLHTENGNLCEVLTTFTTGLTALNGLTAQVQNLSVGTSGTDFAISSVTDTHIFNLPTASASNRGALSSTDWSTFNNKQNSSTRRNANNTSNNNINYCGVALGTGVSESSTVWTITRLTIAASGSITTATATNVAWTNRQSATYI